MPRPKVDPKKRQRSAVACEACKRAKIKCDSATPCGACRRRGRSTSCLYSVEGRRRWSESTGHVHNPSSDTNVSPAHPHSAQLQSRPLSPESGEPIDSDDTQAPRSRMLLSSKFQKLFVGETASLSYLQFLRRIIKRSLGTCRFTEGDFSAFMLESDDFRDAGKVAYDLSRGEKEALAQYYLDAETTGILDLCGREDLFNALSDCQYGDTTFGESTVYLILASGAQCRSAEPNDVQYSRSLFARGQQLAFQGMLCDPSIELVRNFLIMAFYMLGACHRNAAFMYLGIAAKASIALGLHRIEQYHDLTFEECRERYETWKSLRVLDSIVNSILGRSSGLRALQQDSKLKQIGRKFEGDVNVQGTALAASFNICPFLDELEQMSGKEEISSTEKLLHGLRRWSRSLPQELRQSPGEVVAGSNLSREWYIGGAHVACVYYFAVVLATRRYLTNSLLDNIRQQSRPTGVAGVQINDGRSSTLAGVCLDAAQNMALVGHAALDAQQMPRNMCLMKAWIFAAGLLLGFSLFAQASEVATETTQAFEQCSAVLSKLAETSPQAAHYYDILEALSDAVSSRQRQRTEQRARSTRKYLDQIFTNGNTHQTSDDTPSMSVGSLEESPIASSAAVAATGSTDFDLYQQWGDSLGSNDSNAARVFLSPFDNYSFDCTGASFFEDMIQ